MTAIAKDSLSWRDNRKARNRPSASKQPGQALKYPGNLQHLCGEAAPCNRER
jgi:hypothetical protein